MANEDVGILAISGSLRTASSNTALVRAAVALGVPGIRVAEYAGLGALPAFNPDDDGDPAPAPVADFRARLQACGAVLISTPEYAHGVPGVLKNALDWLVGSGELIDKPVAVVNVSPRSVHATASLIETLTVMSAHVVGKAAVTIPLATGAASDVEGILGNDAHTTALHATLDSLAAAVRRQAERASDAMR